MKGGVTINRPPRDGNMAFVRSPDKHSIELLQKGAALPPKEPWASMPNTGQVVSARPSLAALLARNEPLYVAALRRFPRRHPRPSSSGPGHRPFTAVTRVRFP